MFRFAKPLRAAILTACAISSINSFSFSDAPLADETQEGIDRETPAQIEAARLRIAREFADAVQPSMMSDDAKIVIADQYAYLDPGHVVPSKLLEEAVTYFDANKDKFPNQNYITIVDFKKRSNLPRFYLIDMATGAVEQYRTTHGIGSDKNNDGYAESFGNVINSGKSSLGFARTGEVYWGKFKRSVRLDGLSTTNSNIRARAVVFHGWDNVKEENRLQGRSWGCITLDWRVKDGVLDKIKEGSLMYVGVSN